MKYVHNTINLPATAHSRFWSSNVTYAKQNGGSYDFIIDTDKGESIPNDQLFWDDLMYNATQWGLLTYEQDWLTNQIMNVKQVLRDINLGRNWLLQMGEGALKNNITIQYCMSQSRHVLQSLEIPAVTQVRVSGDYYGNWLGIIITKVH